MKLNITVEGKTYEVDVEVAEPEPQARVSPAYSPRAAFAPPAARGSANGAAAPASNVADDKAIKSPLAGVVNAVEVAAGDEVTPDQPVVVLEAMKMLTTITSPSAAKIKEIHVAVGDGVKQGQLLVEFE